MTVLEIKKMYENEYDDIEFYKYNSGKHIIHTDYIDSLDPVDDDAEVANYELMNEEEYDATVLANSCISANFGEWYRNENAKVLVIVI